MIDIHHLDTISMDCSMTEFVGTTVLDTIGLVIPGTSPALLDQMALKKKLPQSRTFKFPYRRCRTDQCGR